MNFIAKSYSTKTNARKAALRLLTKHVAIERVVIINGKPFARWFLVIADQEVQS